MVYDLIIQTLAEITKSLSDISQVLVDNPLFSQIGVLILFIWTAIPSSIPISEVITLPLLVSGVSPVVLVLVATVGATTGNFILYLMGKGAYIAIKGRRKQQAEARSLFRKYSFPIFTFIPFLFFIGDILVVLAGTQRVGFKNMVPFLLAGELVRQTLGILALMGLIKLPDLLKLSLFGNL